MEGRLESSSSSWIVYLLECSDGSTYIGITTDVERRVRQHNAGRASRYTRGRLPVTLLGTLTCAGHGDALRREARLKAQDPGGRRRAFGAPAPKPVPLELGAQE